MQKVTKSFSREQVQATWYLVDLEGKVLGRAATKIAEVLRGKNKATYTPHADTGDFVVVINAKKVKLTGNKATQKNYYRHSNHIGGLKTIPYEEMLAKHPDEVIHQAVKGMLPKTDLGRHLLKKLKVYADASHPHAAQQLQALPLA